MNSENQNPTNTIAIMQFFCFVCTLPSRENKCFGYTVKPLYNGQSGAELTARCREVLIRVKCMDRRTVGKKNPGC